MTVMSRRTAHTLSAGAMADIGFLLLAFFFLVTTITEERGILVTLPEWNAPAATVSEENVFHIHVNGRNEIMADGTRSCRKISGVWYRQQVWPCISIHSLTAKKRQSEIQFPLLCQRQIQPASKPFA